MQQVQRSSRKEKVGVVVSDKMDKTITVQVERLTHNPRIGKTVKKYSKFKAHDEKGEAKAGNTVRIVETRPLSKTKKWRLVEVFKTGKK